ncbi:MAG TPA: wax ester/triacylglycerol synthase family O-acyltransferase [Acidimicrobiales bacterium]
MTRPDRGQHDGLVETGDRMTTLDASFLWFERPGVPVHLGAVATFEGAPLKDPAGRLRIDDLRARVEAGLAALPKLRRRLVSVPFGLDRPRWVDDTGFDVARHVEALEIPPPGDDSALRHLAERLHGEPLPRDRPLWHLCFVTGLTGGRIGLIERVHHSLVDGVSGVDAVAILLDVEPDAPTPPGDRWQPAPTPPPAALAADALFDRGIDAVRALRRTAATAIRPAEMVRSASVVASGLASVVRDGLVAPPSSLNSSIGAGRRFAWVHSRFRDAADVGHSVGGTVNDVVLSAVAGGLRYLLLGRGELVPHDLTMKVLVPVSVRREEERGTLGNRVGSVFAALPVGIGDPARRLARVTATTRSLKAGNEAASTEMLLRAADAVPPGIGRAIVRAIDRQPFINLIVTNVPGPQFPLYALGARLLDAYPIVPLGANLSVGVAILSYDGALNIGFTADTTQCRDVETFAEGTARSLGQVGVESRVVAADAAEG